MRYAIVSDLHANLRAWNAVLADLCDQGAHQVVCLGDIVGYGPNPAEVLAAVRAVTENCVMGNHDAAAVGMMDYSIFNDHARQAIEWTMGVLGPEDKAFLSSAPLAIDAGDLLFVHAEMTLPGRFNYITDPRIAGENFAATPHFLTFVGHTHLPKIFEQNARGKVRELPDDDLVLDADKRYIVNVGSVGEPRNARDLRARYVMYDDVTRTVTFRRVEFDIVAYRRDLEATTLALRPFFLRVYEQVVEGHGQAAANADNLVDMRVAHDSETLVDLGQVAGVAHLHNAGGRLQGARGSRLPAILLTLAAALALALTGSWIFSDPGPREARKTTPSDPALPTPAAPHSPARDTPSPHRPSPPQEVKQATKESQPPLVAERPAIAPPDPPQPRPPRPEPVEDTPLETAWWRLGEESPGEPLIDETGRMPLATIHEGQVIKALAPDPIPANQVRNTSARQLGVWEEMNPRNHFALTADHSFTFEGWLYVGDFHRPIFLMGTRPGESDGPGWHLDLRPPSRGQKNESMSFFYDSGTRQSEALATGLLITDSRPHHFAIVWDHEAMAAEGMMTVYLDGTLVASARLPHAQITGKQIHPFRLGADFNPAKLGLDELRFTRRRLYPYEFLLRAPVSGPTLVRADGRMTDSWSIPANWQNGTPPAPSDNALIAPGLKVQIHHRPPPAFTGSLVLQESASLHLWSAASEVVIPRKPSALIMHRNSRLILRSRETTRLGQLELREDAHIFGGISTSGHHRTRRFTEEITGPGQLILNGVNGNTFSLESPATFQGGTETRSVGNQRFEINAAANHCFGTGQVVIGEHASLKIAKGLRDVIADDRSLVLSGPGGKLDRKLVLQSDEQVARFVVDGVNQGKGTFNSATHPTLISGPGRLVVIPPGN